MRFFLALLLTFSLHAAPSKKKKSPPPKPLIVLDPGHGGFDLGASVGSTSEKYLALSTALLTKKYLQRKGYKVIMTRTRDIFIPLKDRAHTANKTRGKLFVSFHFNSAKNTSAKGIEIYYYGSGNKWRRNASNKLAKTVLSRLLTTTKASSRGVKKGNFHVIRETKMPAILIEGGFMTNKTEGNRLRDFKYRDKLARATADGIHRYFRK